MIVVRATLALCLTLQMSNLGAHLGEHFASRDRHHLDRWRVALITGLAQKRCVAIARSTGLRCRAMPLKFSTKCRCHCLGSERIAVDAKRLSWLERQLPRTGNAKVRANVEARIASYRTPSAALGVANRPNRRGRNYLAQPLRSRACVRMAALRREGRRSRRTNGAMPRPSPVGGRIMHRPADDPTKRRSRVYEPRSRMKLNGSGVSLRWSA